MAVSRDQFDETKNWTEPQWQEGVPVMDADLNLAVKIGKTGLRRAVCDFLGNGSPDEGFKLSGSVADPTIHAGNIWVAGLRIGLPENITASAQPNAPVTFPSGDGVWYLDVVEALITNVEDPAIRDSRLPSNVETPIKVWKTDWTLRKAAGATMPASDPNHYHIGVALEAGGVFADIRNDGMIVAGADTGFESSAGQRPGGGHRHHDEDIDVDSPNYAGETLEEVLDEIDSRIETVEGGLGAVGPHAATHAGGGSDPVPVSTLPGQCSQSQISNAHSLIHTPAFNNGLLILPDVNGNGSLGAHLLDASIHGGGGGGVTSHPALTGLDWSAAGHIMDTHLLPKDDLAYRNVGNSSLRWCAFHGMYLDLYPNLSSANKNSLAYNNFHLTTDFVFNRDWGGGTWPALHITYGVYRGSLCAAFKTGPNAVFDSNHSPIVNVPTPADATDAANKEYVDNAVGGVDPAEHTALHTASFNRSMNIGTQHFGQEGAAWTLADHLERGINGLSKIHGRVATLIVDVAGNGDFTTLADALDYLAGGNGLVFVRSGTYAGTTKTGLGNVAIVGECRDASVFSSALSVTPADGKNLSISALSAQSLTVNGKYGVLSVRDVKATTNITANFSTHGSHAAVEGCAAGGAISLHGSTLAGASQGIIRNCVAPIVRCVDFKNIVVRDNICVNVGSEQAIEVGFSGGLASVSGNFVKLPASISGGFCCFGISVFSNPSYPNGRYVVSDNHVIGNASLVLPGDMLNRAAVGILCESTGSGDIILIHNNIVEEFNNTAKDFAVLGSNCAVVTRDNIYKDTNGENGVTNAAGNYSI